MKEADNRELLTVLEQTTNWQRRSVGLLHLDLLTLERYLLKRELERRLEADDDE